jgi:hypothetical protein
MHLKEPKHKILSVLFSSSDKSKRMGNDNEVDFAKQNSGIKYGISGNQWQKHINVKKEEKDNLYKETEEEKYICVGSSSSIGRYEIEFISITYSTNSFIRFFPVLTLRDLDEAMFLPILNKSLAEKIKAIHIYSNDYKLQEISIDDFTIDNAQFEFKIPVLFSEEELEDSWVRIRPNIASTFDFRFFEETQNGYLAQVKLWIA